MDSKYDLKHLNKYYDEEMMDCSTAKEEQQSRCNNVDLCTLCGEYINIVHGIYTCETCGAEFGSYINSTAEWCIYTDDSHTKGVQRCNVITNDLLFEASTGTVLAGNGRSGKMWMSSNERSIYLVFNKLKYYGANGGLTGNIVELAQQLYADLYKKQSNDPRYTQSRGDFRDGIIATCLLYACNEYNVSRSIQEISKICNVDQSDITRGKKLFIEIMKDSTIVDMSKTTMSYTDYIERYCSSLRINTEMTELLYDITKIVNDKKIASRNTPQSMVCGCIYFISIILHIVGLKLSLSHKKE